MENRPASEGRCCGPEGCGTPGNPWPDGTVSRFCIGQDCHGWRWSDPALELCGTIHNSSYTPMQAGLGEGWEWNRDLQGWVRPLAGRRGYCGLAGRPEMIEKAVVL